jgi:hypothetical protein
MKIIFRRHPLITISLSTFNTLNLDCSVLLKLEARTLRCTSIIIASKISSIRERLPQVKEYKQKR